MASAHFSRVFFIRTLSYFLAFIGFFSFVFQFGPLIVSEFNFRKGQVMGERYTVSPTIITSRGSNGGGSSGFGSLSAPSEKIITPVSTDYGIVIEKINANARVVPSVDPGSEKEYTRALASGVAEAKGSTVPGQPGNLYIFSHSADAPWNIARFNAVFYLLRELSYGDRIIIFYQGKRYDYNVFDKQITAPTDTSFIRNRYDKPVLTLQTCDPPGTLLNRLVIRAQLVGS